MSLLVRHLHPHPSLPVLPRALHLPCHRDATALENVTKRISACMSRLYARRIIEIAAASLATMAFTAKVDAEINSDNRPPEWDTDDIERQRKDFGDKISTLGRTRIERLWEAGSRIVNLACLASPLAALVPLAYITGPDSKMTNFAWDYAIWSVEKAGPTFIKLVQWASTRNDIFPHNFISKFSKLQDDTMGHSWKETKRILEESLGPGYEDIFEFEDNAAHRKGLFKGWRLNSESVRPIGSGCVAQVYKAKLRQNTSLHPSGTEVAIKVTHPHILHKVCVDFYILNKIVVLLEAIPRLNLNYLSMKDSVGQFRDIMLPQLDLRVEARNLKRFRRDFADNPEVFFPLPVDGLTTSRVLVESFAHGEPLLKYMRNEHTTVEDRKELAIIGLETVMKMIFMNDFVHGDLHPGNILVDRRESGRGGGRLRMNMIDCGLVVEIGESDHVNLVKILGALIKKDGLLAGQLMADTSKKCYGSKLDIEMFSNGIQKICKDDEDNNFLESVGDYLSDICHLACKHKVKLEASFINAALACEIMEGIASTLCPTLEVQKYALPMVIKAEMMHGLRGGLRGMNLL